MTRRGFLQASAAFAIHGRQGGAQPKSLFEDVTERAGITWKHDNAFSEARYLPETMGPGCAFLDFDNDGWMDIYLVNSGPSDFYQPRTPPRNALYRNNRDGTFTDVTQKAGVAGGTFGMGVAVGDYNNDGFPDMFVSAFGRCILYRNNGDGTFTDVTEKAGVATPGWTTSAVWFDYDGDGRLDLFVCSFVEYNASSVRLCGDNRLGRNHYCIPRVFKPSASYLYRNNGDGTFTETGRGTAIAKALGKSLGVVAADVNNDGRMDLFVANDTVQNFLFMNRGPGEKGETVWEEVALQAGVGFSESGNPRSGMGVDAADVDGDGWQDLFVANIDQELFSLYHNDHDGTFSDHARKHDVAQASRNLSGWGLKFFDYDNDGNLDLILANGHPDDMIEQYSKLTTHQEPLVLFRQTGGILRNVSAEAGPAFARRYSARGLAVGDFRNTGQLDLLVGVNGGKPVLLKNRVEGNHWLGIKLQGSTCNRDAIGARITWSVAGVKRSREKTSGGSYLSSHDPREILGLGRAPKVDWLEVKWPSPSNKTERFTDLGVDRYVSIVEGSSKE